MPRPALSSLLTTIGVNPWRMLVASVALTALGLYAIRGGIADGIVSRGDVFLQSGQASDALNFYERALAIVPTSAAASTRYATLRCRRHRDRASMADGIVIASRAIDVEPYNVPLRAARGVCFAMLGEPALAYRDFAIVAAARNESGWDPRMLGWAAETAKRAGDVAGYLHWHPLAVEAMRVKK